jgi:hypothetical protein
MRFGFGGLLGRNFLMWFWDGILRKMGVKRGFWVDKVWWIAWQTWLVDVRFLCRLTIFGACGVGIWTPSTHKYADPLMPALGSW